MKQFTPSLINFKRFLKKVSNLWNKLKMFIKKDHDSQEPKILSSNFIRYSNAFFAVSCCFLDEILSN